MNRLKPAENPKTPARSPQAFFHSGWRSDRPRGWVQSFRALSRPGKIRAAINALQGPVRIIGPVGRKAQFATGPQKPCQIFNHALPKACRLRSTQHASEDRQMSPSALKLSMYAKATLSTHRERFNNQSGPIINDVCKRAENLQARAALPLPTLSVA